MKLQNVKRGVRVEAKQAIDSRILKGTKGTILESNDDRPYVEWDDFTDGHSHCNPTVPNSVRAVHIEYLRRIKD